MRPMLSLATVAALFLLPVAATAAPPELTHTGRLVDAAGSALEGTHDVTLRLYDAPSGGQLLWEERRTVELSGGFYAFSIGSNPAAPLPDGLFDGDDVYVSVAVDDGPELVDRQRVRSVPYALSAGVAREVRGGVVDASELRIDGVTVLDGSGQLTATISWDDIQGAPDGLEDGDDDALGALACASGEIAMFDGLAWQCASATDHEHDAAAITTGTFDVARLPVGSGTGTVAAGDHTHDAAATTTGVFDPARIPDLDAGKITGGTFDPARIPGLDAAKITGGTLDPARIPGLDAAKITAGTLDPARIPTLDGSKITGSLSVTNLTVNGTLTAPNVPIGRVTTLRVRATGLNQTGNLDRNVVVNGVDSAGNSRGLHVTVISRANGSVVATRTYDTHGDAAATAAMVTYLNSLNDTVVVAIASYDAWTTALSAAAKDALVRVGASNRVYQLKGGCCDDVTTDSRAAYALVGIPGRGVGSGIEDLQPSSVGPIELATFLVDGDLVGQGNRDRCPPGWYDIGQTCVEYYGAGDNQSWRQTADRCYNLRARMCSAYEMHTAIRLFGATLDIGPGLSHPHIDQIAPGRNDGNWANYIVMQGWTDSLSSVSSWTPDTANGNSRNICCVDK